MQEYVVVKEFKTVNRRFPVGKPVTEADLVPFTADDRVKRGFIEPKRPPQSPAVVIAAPASKSGGGAAAAVPAEADAG